ncbi:MAG: S8 family serine peptidase [Silvanigrellales bacterium]|nr:S8 family serine peptidase [Silvanigrellales bacterium]
MRRISQAILGLAFLACVACGRSSQTSRSSPGQTVENFPGVAVPKDAQKSLARAERRSLAAKPEVTSPESRALVKSLEAGALPAVSGTAQIGILYFQDSPAHRTALFRWLEARGAEVLFEDETLGYLDARLNWTGVAELIDTSGDLGLDATSFLKLEIDVSVDNAPVPRDPSTRNSPGDVEPSGFFGAVHSAGFGTKLDAFRSLAAAELGMKPSDIEGQGMLVASADSGFNASRTDVFQNRLVDFLVGDEDDWKPATKNLSEFLEKEASRSVPAGLEDWAENPALRFVMLEEKEFDADLNGSGAKDDALALAVLQHQGKPAVRVRTHAGASFGDTLFDFGEAVELGQPSLVDLRTGRHYVRSGLRPSHSALGVKMRTNEKTSEIEVAFVGVSPGAEHGTANLHMVGGNYTSPDGTAVFKGVAPSVTHVAMQTWGVTGVTYGMKWIPLARNVSQAVRRGADVINLDIYTPGTRSGNDMLSQLSCRVSTLTNAVIVVAAHNFGPSPNTVQSLAQSPCVLGIGAAHSVAELKNARNLASLDPALVLEGDDALQTTAYSGRGFGLNGLLKPDIVAPNYGYTAYGEGFTRFGGTSGATPTTAGLIALLKQAARMKGIELNFAQVRFLLQGSSRAVREGRYRDGYGYVDLEAAWKLLGALTRAGASGAFEPLLVTGHRPLEFVSPPPNARMALPLGQMPQRGVADVPRRMVFEIEFGGDSRSLQKPWLAFVENATGTLTSTLRLDIPLSSGVSESLPLAFLLTGEDWARLPPGDHIALVKGYRTDLFEVSRTFGRVADFIQPISVRKARTETDAVLPVTPLSTYQFQTFAFETLPGEVLFLSAMPVCEGVQVPNADGGAPASAFELLVDADPTAAHASEVMNTQGCFAPLA